MEFYILNSFTVSFMFFTIWKVNALKFFIYRVKQSMCVLSKLVSSWYVCNLKSRQKISVSKWSDSGGAGCSECVLSPFSRVWFFMILWSVARQAPLSMGFSRQEYRGGCHFFLQGIFLIQELNLYLLCLLHCRQILYRWATGKLCI